MIDVEWRRALESLARYRGVTMEQVENCRTVDELAALLTPPVETAAPRAARYERALKAIADARFVQNFNAMGHAGGRLPTHLDAYDWIEWAQQTAKDVLDGDEAECPKCGTAFHEGACVSEEDKE